MITKEQSVSFEDQFSIVRTKSRMTRADRFAKTSLFAGVRPVNFEPSPLSLLRY